MSDEIPDTELASESLQKRGALRWLLMGLGLFFALLALLGVFLPVLPTTPFLIVAAACFARSSERFHRKLLENRFFGPYIRQWQSDHTVPLAAKRKAFGLLVLSFGLSIALVEISWLRVTMACIGLAVAAFLAWLPTSKSSVPASSTSAVPPPE